jgi:hypothetical protein
MSAEREIEAKAEAARGRRNFADAMFFSFLLCLLGIMGGYLVGAHFG